LLLDFGQLIIQHTPLIVELSVVRIIFSAQALHILQHLSLHALGVPKAACEKADARRYDDDCGFDWRIHCGVEVIELSTNKQHCLKQIVRGRRVLCLDVEAEPAPIFFLGPLQNQSLGSRLGSVHYTTTILRSLTPLLILVLVGVAQEVVEGVAQEVVEFVNFVAKVVDFSSILLPKSSKSTTAERASQPRMSCRLVEVDTRICVNPSPQVGLTTEGVSAQLPRSGAHHSRKREGSAEHTILSLTLLDSEPERSQLIIQHTPLFVELSVVRIICSAQAMHILQRLSLHARGAPKAACEKDDARRYDDDCGFGWRIHCGVEVIELSTKTQHPDEQIVARGQPLLCLDVEAGPAPMFVLGPRALLSDQLEPSGPPAGSTSRRAVYHSQPSRLRILGGAHHSQPAAPVPAPPPSTSRRAAHHSRPSRQPAAPVPAPGAQTGTDARLRRRLIIRCSPIRYQ
jgi:hypothetical protein